MRPSLLLLLLLLEVSFPLHAQPTFEVGDYVRNATTIERVQAEGNSPAPDKTLLPPPPDKRRVWVEEVLKGVDSTQEFFVPAASLAPGQEALVVFCYEPPARNDIAVKQKRETPRPEPLIWPLDAATGKVNTGPITAGMGSTWSYDPKAINLLEQHLIRDAVAQQSPEQVGLDAQVLDAVLFPERLRTLAKADAPRANFVRFVATIYDLEHDVAALACLLGSRNPELRAAAVSKLEALTGARVPPPGHTSAEDMRHWVESQTERIAPKPASRWPAVPENLQFPADDFSPALLESLETNDADYFAREYVLWIGGGARRDWSIWAAASLDRQIVEENSLEGGVGGYGRSLPPAPRLRPELVFNPALPAKARLKGIALFAQLVHFERFARERAAANDIIPNQVKFDGLASTLTGPSMEAMNAKLFPTRGGADTETLRRAAFWEISGLFNQFPDPGQTAMCRLAERDDEETQRFVLALCTNPNGPDTRKAALTEIRLGHQPFVDDLLAYMRGHRDEQSKRIAFLFDQTNQPQTNAYYFDWLKDSSADPKSRWEAALRLCQHPDRSPRGTADLLTIFHAETDAKVKMQLLIALAQTGDPRVLDTLLAALPTATEWEEKLEVVRGLGRVRDKRALSTLAGLVGSGPEIDRSASRDLSERVAADLRGEAAQIFGWVAGYKDVWPPTQFGGGTGVRQDWLKRDFRRVAAWREQGTVVPTSAVRKRLAIPTPPSAVPGR